MPKSHCNYGHAMTSENTVIVQPNQSKYPWRQCRSCMELTTAEVAEIEHKIRDGAALRSLGLSFAKSLGLDIYREQNPKWSAMIEALSAINAKAAKIASIRQRTSARTHCGRGHELTPTNLDVEMFNATSWWNPRACLTCRTILDRDPRYRAEEVKPVYQRREVKHVEIGHIHRTHCKQGHPLTPDNIVISVGSTGHKHHQCKICCDLTEEDAASLMRQAREGVALKRMVTAPGKDRNSLKRYRENNPEWDATFTPLIQANSLAIRIAGTKRLKQAITHCLRGHPLSGENIYYMKNGARQCRACMAYRSQKPASKTQVERAKRALLTGLGVMDIIKRGNGKERIMSPEQWKLLRTTDAAFNRFVLEKTQNPRSVVVMQNRLGIAPIAGIIRAVPKENVNTDKTIPLYEPRPGDYEWLYSLTPRNMLKSDRDEVVSNIYMELAERRLRREDVPSRVRAMTQQHHKLFPQREAGSFNAPLSLDAPVYLDGTTLRGETVSESLWERI
ncbi:hypothetical protein [Bradyrhizobium sp. ORS 111]|uniref:hypothetical protein n=1 Tax=Bradyrhizobium sp. ORS 111 TaxID=1685958 RepID=UPI0038910880